MSLIKPTLKQKKTLVNLIGFLGVGLFLLIFYAFLVPQTGFWDYDACKNNQIIFEMHEGNFKNVFHHAAPFFHIMFFGVSFISKNIIFLNFINILLVLVGVFYFTKTVLKSEKQLFILFFGLSFFMISVGKYFSIEALSFLIFCIFLRYYKKENPSFLYMGILLGLLLTTNYKAALVIGILGLYDLLSWILLYFYKKTENSQEQFQPQKTFTKLVKKWFFVSVGVFCVYVCWGVLGMCVGLPFYQLLAVFVAIVWQPDFIRENGQDWGFYFYYFWDFENIWVFLGTGLAVFYTFKKLKNNYLSFDVRVSMELFFVLLYVTLMTFLPKAPRGLLFVYPMIYLIAWQGLQGIFKQKYLFYLIIFGSCGLQIFRFFEFLYPYRSSNYKKIADYLSQKNVSAVVSVGSLQIAPFLASNIKIIPILSEKDLLKVKNKEVSYVIVDACAEIDNLRIAQSFDSERHILQYAEPSLLLPMLYLEHAEFSGRSYKQSIEKQRDMRSKKYHLKLYQLQKELLNR